MLEKMYMKEYYLSSYKTILVLLIVDLFLSFSFTILWKNDPNFNLQGDALIIFIFFFSNVITAQIITDFCLKCKTILFNIDDNRISSSKIIDILIILIVISLYLLKLSIFNIFFQISADVLYTVLFDSFQMILVYKFMFILIQKSGIKEIGLYSLSILLSSFVCSNTTNFDFNIDFELFKIIALVLSILLVRLKKNKKNKYLYLKF